MVGEVDMGDPGHTEQIDEDAGQDQRIHKHVLDQEDKPEVDRLAKHMLPGDEAGHA